MQLLLQAMQLLLLPMQLLLQAMQLLLQPTTPLLFSLALASAPLPALLQLLGFERVSDIREQLYIMLPASARKAGWDTRSIQTALIVPSLGFSQGSPRERGVRLFDAIVGGKLSMHQLQQAETAALNALID